VLVCTINFENEIFLKCDCLLQKPNASPIPEPNSSSNCLSTALRLCTHSRAVKVEQRSVQGPSAIAVLRMEDHVPSIVIDICASGRRQAISITSLEV
jgi:hypothetical protein